MGCGNTKIDNVLIEKERFLTIRENKRMLFLEKKRESKVDMIKRINKRKINQKKRNWHIN